MRHKYIIIFLSLILITTLGGCHSLSPEDILHLPTQSPTTSNPEALTTPTSLSDSAATEEPSVTKAPSPAAVTPTVTPILTATPPATALTQSHVSSDIADQAQDILKTMSLEEKVGQMFFVRCRKEQALSDISDYHLGGYLLFGDDFKEQSKKDMAAAISGYQKQSEIPMLIGVDEEGGTVNRVSKYPAFRAVPFWSPQDLYQEGGFDLIRSDTEEKATLLLGLGINVNLAPVCDVSTDPEDFMYQRSFGKNAKKTSEYVKTVVTEMTRDGIGSTLKHFPGYGNNVDTHTGIAVDQRSYESFVKKDFLPFQAGIDAGAGSILVSHTVVTSMDQDYPASLSPEVHRILREELGFDGVVMTDDLSMDAIKEYTDNEAAAVLVVTAGNDLLVATDFDVQIPAVLAAVQDGTLSEDRIDQSVLRILIWKLELKIIK